MNEERLVDYWIDGLMVVGALLALLAFLSVAVEEPRKTAIFTVFILAFFIVPYLFGRALEVLQS